MSNPPFTKFICTVCGHGDKPCKHWWQSENDRRFIWIEHALCEIISILNRPQSATLKVNNRETLFLVGAKPMPATILVGGTASSLFQEWTGPSGTGTVVPPAGAPAFTSSNPAVATVDPASGLATGVSAGTAVITGTDPVNNLSASDTLIVNNLPAVSATEVLTAN